MTAPATFTRRTAIRAAARVWRAGLDAMDGLTVQEAARACHTPGGPTLRELEQAITADRSARTTTGIAAA